MSSSFHINHKKDAPKAGDGNVAAFSTSTFFIINYKKDAPKAGDGNDFYVVGFRLREADKKDAPKAGDGNTPH